MTKKVCFCGLIHGDYKNDEHALLSDAYHDIYQRALPGKAWMEAVFDLLNTSDTPTKCKAHNEQDCERCSVLEL